MEQLPNGITLELAEGAFPLSTDSVVLKAFVRLKRNARVLDLGAGCGTLGLLLCGEDPTCHVTGIELDPAAHEMALRNFQRNNLQTRLESICGDLRQLPGEFTGHFDCCVSNPPYYTGGPVSVRTPLARHQDCCSPAELFAAASKALRYGGDFYLVHKPERMAELILRGAEAGLEAKRVQLIRHKEGGSITLILLQFRKGGKPGLIWEENALFDKDGSPTPYFNRIYHME